MKIVRTVSFAFALAALGMPSWAAKEVEHQAHHPATAASASPAKALPPKPGPDIARMDTQMKGMREMHEKMMAAKTPDERSALMTEHMQSMKEGMAMMTGMSGGGMGGMKGIKGVQGDLPAQHQMMEKRMEMMQTMLQMMMDRLPAAPAK